jgi:hypothetical protein
MFSPLGPWTSGHAGLQDRGWAFKAPDGFFPDGFGWTLPTSALCLDPAPLILLCRIHLSVSLCLHYVPSTLSGWNCGRSSTGLE